MTKLSEQLRVLADRAAQPSSSALRRLRKRPSRSVMRRWPRLWPGSKEQQESPSRRVTAMTEDAQAAWRGVKDSLKNAGDKDALQRGEVLHPRSEGTLQPSLPTGQRPTPTTQSNSALLAVAEADAALMESMCSLAQRAGNGLRTLNPTRRAVR